ncbi:MAG: IS4 family transposase [Calothrix sp. C42_A2020_038]|nr:IS4 family transposase [Calothrix sp. C42_A2020_038]
MLPLFYQTHLKNKLEPSEFLFFNILINILQDIKEVSLEKLATALPLPILFESRRKKIQRFLSLPIINIKTLWFPIIKDWLAQSFTDNQPIYLVIDRTIWERKNLIMISIISDQRAIPVYFEFLPKLGSSNFDEQTKFISQILSLFKEYKIILLGDREFCSIKLANWLREEELMFCLRLKKNEFIEIEDDVWQELNDLGLKPGVSFFIEGIKVTKTQKMGGFNLAAKWKRKVGGTVPKEGWFILTNLDNLESAIASYKKRFDIEEMFRDFKSGGYNLEDTNVSGNRLISLILIIAFAYSSATFKGQIIKSKGVQKYVGRIKEYGRIQRRHSCFYIGLYGQIWVNFMESCWSLVTELMRLNLNKLEYYLKGQKAMKHILSAF